MKKLGNIIIILLIFICAPIAIPKFIGFGEFNVISGSMEPEIPVGSLVYVKPTEFDDLKERDIIAFESGASVVTHRIVSIEKDNQLITTKGDANSNPDFMPVAYTNIIGRVSLHIPFLGYVAAGLSKPIGKLIAAIILIIGILLTNFSEKLANKDGKTERGAKQSVNPNVFLALGIVIVLGSLGGFLYIYLGYQKDKDYYAEIQDEYFKWPYQQYPEGPQGGEFPWYESMYVNLEGLQQINSDVIGWIYIEGTDINYPVLYSGDDTAYLRTNLNKEHANAGSIFLEGYNLPDWSDSHNIIYGHNMRDLSMFGKLKYYKTDDSFYNDHKYFQIITKEGRQRYEIFSYFDTEAASWVYTVPYYDNQEFADYIEKLNADSYKKTGVEVKSSDKVVTLSTCSDTGIRFTVHGVLVDTQ